VDEHEEERNPLHVQAQRKSDVRLRTTLALVALQPCVLCHHDKVGVVGVYVRGERMIAYALCADCCAHSDVLEQVEDVEDHRV
jgi:hypothetical protein